PAGWATAGATRRDVTNAALRVAPTTSRVLIFAEDITHPRRPPTLGGSLSSAAGYPCADAAGTAGPRRRAPGKTRAGPRTRGGIRHGPRLCCSAMEAFSHAC